MNLGMFLTRAAWYWAEEEALVCGDSRYRFAQLDAAANRLASALLARGASTGTVVATYSDNRAEMAITELAVYKAGLIRAPISARLAECEAESAVRYVDAGVLFTDSAHLQAARACVAGRDDCLVVSFDEVDGCLTFADLLVEGSAQDVYVDVAESDPAVLHFTSGSTGRLKAVTQTHGNRLANLRKRAMGFDGLVGVGERFLVAGPMTHVSGMGILATLSRGAAVHVLPKWSVSEFLRVVETEKITATFLVPAMLNMVMAAEEARRADLSSLQSLGIGAAPISPQRLRDAVDLFGPIISQGYGQGETTSGITALTKEDVARGVASDPEILLSCGRPMFDSEVRVVGDDGYAPLPPGERGEVVVRGNDCAKEYWREPDLTAETFRNGWVHTGDIGYFRSDGYLIVVDRKKDMIISGGYNIYCAEVEAALYEHPAVLEVCVIGVPDEHWGESVKAVVVRRPDHDVSEEALIDHCTKTLARIKKPKSIDFVAQLPLNRNGKIDRKAVREPFWAGAARAVN